MPNLSDARAQSARVVSLLEVIHGAVADGETDRALRLVNAAHQEAQAVRGFLIYLESQELARRTAAVAGRIRGESEEK